ncbi:hypothetical protein DJ010_07935 [Nocardioides silvaticus]|uniref:Sensor-like histidine kinase SenX3 n=1 Tax=Nocardioides silvaticus TaxID=2201891 RepID=A0A316TJM2_9ACTN|nr:hypothetical protein DJ010_07935 [Nocardioides silvaticus]
MERAVIVEGVGKRACLVALYLLAAVVGRASVIDSHPMALVWPAGGLAVAWLVTRPSPREWFVDVPLLVSVGVAASLIADRSVEATAVLAVSNVVAVLTIVLAYRRWNADGVRLGTPPTRSPHAMGTFLGAVVLGSLVGVAAGVAASAVAGSAVSPDDLVVWFGRNVCGVAGVGIASLLVIERLRGGRRTTSLGGWAELVLLFTATAGLVALDYSTFLPTSFLLPAVAVWAGSRFASLPVAIHALAGGAGILLLTYVGEGPFSHLEDEGVRIILAQLFVAMTLLIGLLLASAREARAAMSQEMATFAERVAHDLRNPITVTESWTAELAAVLASGPSATREATAPMVAGLERATAHMRSLVESLLADASARDRDARPLVVDLPALVAEVAEAYGAAGQVRTLGVRSVSGDPVLLRQLIDNLVGNALKYVLPGQRPDITVSAHHVHGRVVVRVTDNGIGIPAGAREWIFEPFRRAHEDGYPGTGLGLSTCRRIVERHGGSLRALPREDGPGSVFEFDLPKAMASA